jgi:hypothetical protein
MSPDNSPGPGQQWRCRRAIIIPVFGVRSMFDNSDLDQWEDAFERRTVSRTKMRGGALLFFSGKIGVYSCTVRDVTNRGAGIFTRDLSIVPLNFGISFDNFRTVRTCRLIWRQSDFLGVAFKN